MSVVSAWSVEITCGGCVKAVTAILSKTPGVEKVECDIDGRTVTVTGTASDDVIKAAIEKTGKIATKKEEV